MQYCELYLILYVYSHQQANEHLQKLNQIEDKANRNKQQPNAGLQL